MAPKSTGHGSARYGPCEVCGHHCAEVFIAPDGRGDYVFGHRECLAAVAKDAA